MGTILSISTCAYCGKQFISPKQKTKKPKFCSKDHERFYHSKTPQISSAQNKPLKKPSTKKHQTIQPNITISDVGNFQTYYKTKTSKWLKYTEAAQMLENMSKNELKSLRAEWSKEQLLI